MAILEFLHSFPEVLSLKTYFKYGINFDDLENALTSTDVAGKKFYTYFYIYFYYIFILLINFLFQAHFVI